MKYEETPVEKITNKKAAEIQKNGLAKTINNQSSAWILWQLVKKHKFGLTLTYAIVLTVLWAVPATPQMIMSLFG